MREPLVARILRYFMYAVLAVGVVMLATLPWMLDEYMKVLFDAYYTSESYRTFVIVFLEAAGIVALWVAVELVLILHTIRRDPFVGRNVRALRRIGALALVLAALFFAKCVRYVTFLTIICGIVFVVCALVIFTVGVLFQKAVRYKEENELTI